MATLGELQNEIEAARAAFRAALEGLSTGWEEIPAGDEWTRRHVAEHAIGADYFFAGWPLTLAGGAPAERPELSLTSPAQALEAFAASSANADAAWAGVEASDLQREIRPERTVEQAMELVARHLGEHTEQLGAA